jgi:tetratricopeptide (TPR) repeat protein
VPVRPEAPPTPPHDDTPRLELAIEPGRGWFCPLDANGTCKRQQRDCEEIASASCHKVDSAYCATFIDPNTGAGPVGRTQCYAKAAGCELFREGIVQQEGKRHLCPDLDDRASEVGTDKAEAANCVPARWRGKVPGPTTCREIWASTVDDPSAPPPDFQKAPDGARWYCAYGECVRSLERCKSNWPQGTCDAHETASCQTIVYVESGSDTTWLCYPDNATCQRQRAGHTGPGYKSVSRCGDWGSKIPLDSDGDGIPDKDDRCPNEPEDRNGYQDSDGCPDQAAFLEVKRAAEAAAQKKAEADATATKMKAEADAAAAKKKADADAAAAQKAAEDRRSGAVEHFKQGKAFQDAGAYAEAIAEYEAGYKLEPRPQFLYNIAQSYRLDQKRAQAIDYYKKYLVAQPAGEGSDDARRWIARLTKELRDGR